MVNTEFKTIADLLKDFPTEQSCINHLEELRWNGNIVSPFDSNSRVYKCSLNKYRCKTTGKYFNVRTGTLFDNTKIDLRKWFQAIFITKILNTEISSIQLSKELGITQKTAWIMLSRIKKSLKQNNNSKNER